MEQQSTPITVITNCSWREIRGNDVKLLASGECRVFKEKESLIICIGEVTYTLKPGMSVVVESTDDRVVFVFQSGEDGVMFGLDASISEDVQTLKMLLNDYMYQEKAKQEKPKVVVYGEKLTTAISSFGLHGISAISRAGSLTKKGIDMITEKSKQNIPKAQSPVQISEETKTNAGKAKAATSLAVGVTSTIVKEGVGAAKKMSEQVRPVLKGYMKKHSLSSDKPAGPKSQAAMNLGKQTVKTGLELYIAMKEATKAVMFHAIDATTELVEHRYGDAAGNVAKDMSKAVQNTIEVTSDFAQLGITKTAKNVLLDSVVGEPSNTTPSAGNEVKEQRSEVKEPLNTTTPVSNEVTERSSEAKKDSDLVRSSTTVYDMD